ncbi:MAG: hypothetical protein HY778_14605 [Betaproteobacteria bacterium]|nr:hypothetical protein [Betaproteobacteria bacterium]
MARFRSGGLIPPSHEGIEMDAIVIEHVPVAELPPAWRAKLAQSGDARVTVRIETESEVAEAQAAAALADDPLFGMWRDREDMADVAAYIRRIRAPRFSSAGDEATRGGDAEPGTSAGN